MKSLIIIPVMLVTLCITACSDSSLSAYQAGSIAYQKGHYKTAYHHFLYAAKRNLPAAQYAVGYQYYYGIGTPADTFKSVYWFKRAAPQSKRAVYALEKINAHQDELPFAAGLTHSDKAPHRLKHHT